MGWLEPDRHIFALNMNWVAFLQDGHAWSSNTGNWLGPVDGFNCLDREGRVVAAVESGRAGAGFGSPGDAGKGRAPGPAASPAAPGVRRPAAPADVARQRVGEVSAGHLARPVNLRRHTQHVAWCRDGDGLDEAYRVACDLAAKVGWNRRLMKASHWQRCQ